MNLPCCAVRDLLPLYAEELVSPESALLIREHLDGCADCRARLEEVRQPPVPVPEAAAPMKELKKELGRRRLRVKDVVPVKGQQVEARTALVGLHLALLQIGRHPGVQAVGIRVDLGHEQDLLHGCASRCRRGPPAVVYFL